MCNGITELIPCFINYSVSACKTAELSPLLLPRKPKPGEKRLHDCAALTTTVGCLSLAITFKKLL